MTTERKENTPESFTLEDIARLAREVALRDGYHAPTLIVEGDGGPLLGQFPELPETHDGRCEMMQAAGYALAQEAALGELRRVFFISEAWMSTADRGGPPYTPPSQDPRRREVLIVSGLEVQTQQAGMVIFEMVRDEDSELTGLQRFVVPTQDGEHIESPLLEAFVQGFRSGRRARVN
jgi:hypothetical protein